jgi:hypothetical protein
MGSSSFLSIGQIGQESEYLTIRQSANPSLERSVEPTRLQPSKFSRRPLAKSGHKKGWRDMRWKDQKRPRVQQVIVMTACGILLLPWLFLNLSFSFTTSVPPPQLQQLDPQRQQENTTKPMYTIPTRSCFLPNRSRTEVLVAAASALQRHDINNARRHWSIVNLGMPKMGSTSLFHFFLCSNITANHWRTESSDLTAVVLIGECMRDTYENNNNNKSGTASKHQDLIQACTFGAQALTQIDVALSPERCVLPQIQYIQQLLLANDGKTMFILPFRPVDDWLASLYHQVRPDGSRLYDRLQHCLPDGQHNLADVWCDHVTTIRQLVPPDRLLELDLTDHAWTATMLSQFYHTNATCWTQSNRRRDNNQKRSLWNWVVGP